MENVDKIIAGLVEKVERRFHGKYRGLVVDNADPERLGRLRLRVPSVLGSDVVTGWALPCVPYGGAADQGLLFVPEVGAGVWVEFEEGDLEFPIWVGTYWGKPGGASELPKPNKRDGTEESQVQTPPTCKIIKSGKGHTIQLEDKDQGERVTILAYGDPSKPPHVIVLDAKGIAITDGINGHELSFDGQGILAKDGANHHQVSLDTKGIGVTDGANQHQVTLNGGGVTIQSQTGAKIQLTSTGVIVDAGPGMVQVNGQPIKLGSSAALPVLRVTDQGIGNLGAPVVMTGPGNPLVLA